MQCFHLSADIFLQRNALSLSLQFPEIEHWKVHIVVHLQSLLLELQLGQNIQPFPHNIHKGGGRGFERFASFIGQNNRWVRQAIDGLSLSNYSKDFLLSPTQKSESSALNSVKQFKICLLESQWGREELNFVLSCLQGLVSDGIDFHGNRLDLFHQYMPL